MTTAALHFGAYLCFARRCELCCLRLCRITTAQQLVLHGSVIKARARVMGVFLPRFENVFLAACFISEVEREKIYFKVRLLVAMFLGCFVLVRCQFLKKVMLLSWNIIELLPALKPLEGLKFFKGAGFRVSPVHGFLNELHLKIESKLLLLIRILSFFFATPEILLLA